nr:hypothetical protein [Tanacetum cinerariifolium]
MDTRVVTCKAANLSGGDGGVILADMRGLHYSLKHPSTLIPYPRFTKLIISHYMTAYHEISRRVRDKYHHLEHDEMVKSIFNSEKNKLQPLESIQGTHRKTSAPRSPNTNVDKGELSAQRKSTVIRLRIPPRRLTRLTPLTPRSDPESYKESLEVEKNADVQPVNVIKEEEESGLIMERKQNQADVAKMIANAIQQEHENLRAEIASQINNAITNHIPSQTYTYVIDDDELLAEKVSQELVEEMSQTIGEEKLRKVVNEMLGQRCTSGDEHKYHIDQMQNFLKNDIVWENKKEILTLPFPPKPTLVVQSFERDPKALAISLVNQDLLYLKKVNSGPEKFVLSLHKFPTVIFPDDDIEKTTSRWVNKRENGSIVSVTELDYKNLNKNDIEDMYLLCVNGKVEDYVETGLLWSLIKKYKMFSIVSEPVYGIIYKNNKKEKRVMRHQEIHKFYDATLKRVLEGLKSYNNDVKHGYVTPSLSKEDAEYLQLF